MLRSHCARLSSLVCQSGTIWAVDSPRWKDKALFSGHTVATLWIIDRYRNTAELEQRTLCVATSWDKFASGVGAEVRLSDHQDVARMLHAAIATVSEVRFVQQSRITK
jgi:hypothetical protein